MTFDLNASIVTIGPFEPAMLVSLLIAILGAFGLGRALGAITRRVNDPWRRILYLGPVWLVVGVVMFALPNVVVAILYPLFHPEDRGALVCVAMVWPLFIAAPVLGYAVASVALRRQYATP